jgi:hypothetical protein
MSTTSSNSYKIFWNHINFLNSFISRVQLCQLIPKSKMHTLLILFVSPTSTKDNNKVPYPCRFGITALAI